MTTESTLSHLSNTPADSSPEYMEQLLLEFGFGETGHAKIEDGSLYGWREENGDRRYLGSVANEEAAREVVDAWFSGHATC